MKTTTSQARIRSFVAVPCWDGAKVGYLGPEFATQAEAEAFVQRHRQGPYYYVAVRLDRSVRPSDRSTWDSLPAIAGPDVIRFSEASQFGLSLTSQYDTPLWRHAQQS